MQFFFSKTKIDALHKRDFQDFYFSFRKTIEKYVPTFENLFFCHDEKSAAAFIKTSALYQKIRKYFSSTVPQHELSFCSDNCLFLTIPTKDCNTLAVVTGIDSYFSEKVSASWLSDFCTSLFERFILIKQAGTDLETGLLNSQKFFLTLSQIDQSNPYCLFLCEACPPVRSAKETRLNTARAVNTLRSCLQEKTPIYYLGNGVFALIYSGGVKGSSYNAAKMILSRMRRDGFRRFHIGLAERPDKSTEGADSILSEQTADMAWLALQEARKKGPYSFCDFDYLQHPENHPLRRPSKSLLAKFRRRWKGIDVFSLVQFQFSHSDAYRELISVLPPEASVKDGNDIYVVLKGQQPERALDWAKDIVRQINIRGVMIGVAYHPHTGFSRSATVLNCRKALLHAAFFGENGTAIFDGISCNVSGDIFYGEGNIQEAVKEYKNGLACEPENINLLNSLGVAYGDMARHKMANSCFEKALLYDPDNFMALYNLTLGKALLGRYDEALKHCQRAVALPSEFPDALDDLQLQRGRLYCLTGKYKEGLQVLKKWHGIDDDAKNRGRALRYLGISSYGLGRLREAKTWLQKALKYNEFDAESMGLLGLVYLMEREGDEIALSLCSKSVDLEPGNVTLRLYLGKTQIACNFFQDAKNNLRKCLRDSTTMVEAQLLTCICYKNEGNHSRARYWLARFFEGTDLDQTLLDQAYAIKEEIHAI